jgi:hypothetical protein
MQPITTAHAPSRARCACAWKSVGSTSSNRPANGHGGKGAKWPTTENGYLGELRTTLDLKESGDCGGGGGGGDREEGEEGERR